MPLPIAAATLPLASAERNRSACGAGIVALIGSDSPSASVMQAMVLAVPITMQVPTDGARRPLTASISTVVRSISAGCIWLAMARFQINS